MSEFKVIATSLNMRSNPRISSNNRIAVLPYGQNVSRIGEEHAPWWFVKTVQHGLSIEGYVHSQFLVPHNSFVSPVTVSSISPVHLKENRQSITRSRDGGRAYPLGELDRPTRTGTTEEERISQLGKIIEWLAVEQNERYLRNGGTTYCNIYAYDYCYLAGAYIPRVWWKENALLELARGNEVEVRYGETVRELNANALHDWFKDFGAEFGWRLSVDLTECQETANKGKVVLACAKRVTTNKPGHICAIVPETDQFNSTRGRDGAVRKALQSQAGGSNFRYKAENKWWTSERFQSFGLWIHD